MVRERLAVDFDYGDVPFSVEPVTAVAGRQNLVIVAESKIPNRPGRMMTVASWGIQLSQGFTYNARLEGIASKPTWRDPWRNHRVLVPAGSFFERQGRETWYELQTYAERPFFLGGIAVKDLSDGKRKVVVCTYPTNDEVKFVHSRMPVVVPPTLIHEWFNPETNSDQLIYKLQNERTRFKVTKGTMQLRGAA
jgi:putative SOS response-associated peptidase YedK